jgi:nitrogen fixation/metabolism regulation signal transduction histidine kinase
MPSRPSFLRKHPYLPVGTLFALMLTALYLLSAATQNIAEFGRVYLWILILSALVLLGLTVLIAINIVRLVRQYRAKAIGSRLTLRLVALFVLLSVVPSVIVYGFAQQFLSSGIDSWFDERIDEALDDALVLARAALDESLRERRKQTERAAQALLQPSAGGLALRLDELRQQMGATDLAVWDKSGHPIASSSVDPTRVVPQRPNQAVLLRAQHGDSFVGLEPVGEDKRLIIRVAVHLKINMEGAILHALFPAPERLGKLAGNVERAYNQYQELAFLRVPLKFSFSLTLALALLLSLLTAVWAAFFSARHLAQPIRDLAEGTRAVARGNYDTRLPAAPRDELGLLVRSFNEMTEKIALARDTAERSQRQLEAQHAYLQTVLAHLSSGVVTLSANLTLRTCNAAVAQILGIDMESWRGKPLPGLLTDHPHLAPLVHTIAGRQAAGEREWHQEIVLQPSETRRQVLMSRGAALPIPGPGRSEQVVVFDDITELMRAQRDAAWGEVARRLAHEIKNPLTPIQLSAERLRHKYLRKMDAKDAELLDRLTHTIVQQVEAMKTMVNAFSDYARTPKMSVKPLSINQLVHEVTDLYRAHKQLHLTLDLTPEPTPIQGDSGRLRQLLNNLLKNAQEALQDTASGRIAVRTRSVTEPPACRCIEVRVEDNGPGIPAELMEHLFEPYITGKPKGTGLGLAIVKKIVEEHGGAIHAEHRPEGGTALVARLPLSSSSVEAPSDDNGIETPSFMGKCQVSSAAAGSVPSPATGIAE